MTGLIPSVPELIRRGASAPPRVDPVDAVMGEDWAHLDLGRGGAERRLTYGEARRLGARRRRAAIGGVLAPNPQALVKLIGSGGASDARGLRAQMAYLGREGDVALRASESSLGVEIGLDDAGLLAAAWGVPGQGRGGADRTSHFVVSFPNGTDPGAAERAGRAWAAELFDSGAHGDRWEYYTAFHSDTAYPHIHVVVGRRGAERGEWLKVSARSPITFERLREVQVAVAAREGIALADTSRLARGVHDRPVPDREIRRARAEGRAPVAPAHTPGTARDAAAGVIAHARLYEGAAETIRATHPDLAGRLEDAGHRILAGRALVAETGARAGLTTMEARTMAETIEQIQGEARRNFVEIAAEIDQVRDPAQRARFLRDLAELKAEGAGMLREDTDLQVYRTEAPHHGYRGLPRAGEDDPRGHAIKERAEAEIRRLAKVHGLDPEASVARFAAPVVSMGLGADYAREERRERAARHPDEAPERGRSALAEFHARAQGVYRDAAEALRALGREEPRDAPPRGQARHDAGRDDTGRGGAGEAAPPNLPDAERPARGGRGAPRSRARDDDDDRSR